MPEAPDKLTELEAKLLRREIRKLNARIVEGLKIIKEAFEPYMVTHGPYGEEKTVRLHGDDLKDFTNYINKLKVAYSYYYGGDWLTIPEVGSVSEQTPPEFVQRILLAKASEDLFAALEGLQDEH